jgi:glycosyltransferase involved in cell wall biosynthesis
MPSHYVVDLFDAVHEKGEIQLFVTYLRTLTPGRRWTKLPVPHHPHIILPTWFNNSALFVNPTAIPHLFATDSDLLVVTQYSAVTYQLAMYLAAACGRRWVFWTESPGVRYFEVKSPVPERLRPALQWIAGLPVRRMAQATWAIGSRAQGEMARITGRPCRNLPYFSRLAPYRRNGQAYAPDGRVRFLFAGTLSHRKGFDVLMRAAVRLADSPHAAGRWSLTVCGDGPMRGLCESAPRAEVRYIGFREIAEMPGIMREHDVIVVPSRYDGWAMVVPEGLAAGMPVIASDEVGSALDIGGGDVVRTPKAGDAEGLSREMQEFIERRSELSSLGALAEAIAARYDVALGAARFIDLSKAALGGALAG